MFPVALLGGITGLGVSPGLGKRVDGSGGSLRGKVPNQLGLKEYVGKQEMVLQRTD